MACSDCISADCGHESDSGCIGAIGPSSCCLQVALVLRCASSLINILPQVGQGVLLLGIFFLSFLGQVDGVVPTISLRTISEVKANLLVCFVTERTASERFFHRMVHGGLMVV